MPHIVLEHSIAVAKNINLKKLNEELHQKLSLQDTIKLTSIKTRSIEVDNVIVGDGSNNNFIHINLLLLPGRPEELKKTMADCLFDVAKAHLDSFNCLLSVNVAELGVYKK